LEIAKENIEGQIHRKEGLDNFDDRKLQSTSYLGKLLQPASKNIAET
jgi:hypothetical protein